MDQVKAKTMLERLRLRTEARGATAAEAAQAAVLVERIARRYGLHELPKTESDSRYVPGSKRVPFWLVILASGLGKRFSVDVVWAHHRIDRVGKTPVPPKIVFRGPEHLTTICLWLFLAIKKDLDKQSLLAADGRFRGAQLGKFRRRFSEFAADEINNRLNPPAPRNPTKELLAKVAGESSVVQAAPKPKSKRNRKDPPPMSDLELSALRLGLAAGLRMKIDTNVLPASKHGLLRIS